MAQLCFAPSGGARRTFALLSCLLAAAVSASPAVFGAEPAAKGVLEATQVSAGLCLHLGTTDGALEADLAEGGKRLVHGLTLERAVVAGARNTIQAKGVMGLATVQWVPSLAELPFNDHIANLVIADLDALGKAAPARAEILRVVRPLGVAYLKTGGKWEKVSKPMPPEMDDWTHADQGPEGNPQSDDKLVTTPRGVQWYVSSGGKYTSGIRLAGTRWLSGHQISGRRKGQPPYFGVRDAFNGLPLWSRPESNDIFGVRGLQERSICANDTIVAGLIGDVSVGRVLDAATGKELKVLTEGLQVPKNRKRPWGANLYQLHHLLVGNTLLQSYGPDVVAFDTNTFEVRWRWRSEHSVAYLIGHGSKAFAAISKAPHYEGYHYGNVYAVVDSVVALDLATGKPAWTNTDIGGHQTFGILYHKGGIFSADSNVKDRTTGKELRASYREILGIDAETGKTLFRHDMSGGDPLDRVKYWHVKLRAQEDLLIPTHAAFARGYDIKTGKEGPLLYDLSKASYQDSPLHCSVPRGTANGMLTGKFARFVDFRTGEYSAVSISRNRCDEGSYPGYGMIYTGDDDCGCTSWLRGHVALQCSQSFTPVADDTRLEKGAGAPPATGNAPEQDTQWPVLMGNLRRTNTVKAPLAADLKPALKIPVPVARQDGAIGDDWRLNNLRCGNITPPVVAENTLVVASVDAHTVHAFDAASGAPKWTFTADARVDSSPTIYQGLCLFGSNDGYVYAVRLADGKLAWRFLAAPTRRNIVVSGQVESVWPVHGTIAIHGGKAFVIAGRHNQSDGGMFLYRLDARTGAMEASRVIVLAGNSEARPGLARSDGDAKINDIISTNLSGTLLYCGTILIDPASLHWINLSTAPRVKKGVTGAPPFFSGPDAPKLSFATPDLTSFIFAGSTGAIDRRSSYGGSKGASGFRYNTTASWTGNVADARIALRGNTMFLANLHSDLATLQLQENNEPVKGEKKKLVNPGGGEPCSLVATDTQLLLGQGTDKGGRVLILDNHGKTTQELALPAPVVAYGLAIAYGRLYAATEDGTVTVFAP